MTLNASSTVVDALAAAAFIAPVCSPAFWRSDQSARGSLSDADTVDPPVPESHPRPLEPGASPSAVFLCAGKQPANAVDGRKERQDRHIVLHG